ncbi:Uncharacterised protein [Escherichia coli]|nr:Uncharacterised protein [Escherichia coli]
MKNNALELQKNEVGSEWGSLKSGEQKWGVVRNDQKNQR